MPTIITDYPGCTNKFAAIKSFRDLTNTDWRCAKKWVEANMVEFQNENIKD